MLSKEELKIARYCSSRARSASSRARRSVMSRATVSTCRSPRCMNGMVRRSAWKRSPLLRTDSSSTWQVSPASERRTRSSRGSVNFAGTPSES